MLNMTGNLAVAMNSTCEPARSVVVLIMSQILDVGAMKLYLKQVNFDCMFAKLHFPRVSQGKTILVSST
jgi:hypothetical protein